MLRKYRVIIEADFEMYASSPGEIKKRLDRIIKHSGFDNKNFELEISRISQDSEHQIRPITQQDIVKQPAIVNKSQRDIAQQSTTENKTYKRKRRSIKNKSYGKMATTLDELLEKYTKGGKNG